MVAPPCLSPAPPPSIVSQSAVSGEFAGANETLAAPISIELWSQPSGGVRSSRSTSAGKNRDNGCKRDSALLPNTHPKPV